MKYLKSVLICLVAILAGPGSLLAQSGESVEAIQVVIDIDATGTLNVTEIIDYNFGSHQRHGIYRQISKRHAQPATTWYKTRSIEIKNISVRLADQPVPVQINDSAKEVTIRVGDPETYVTGNHTYTISYEVVGALSYYNDEVTELYWNATGNDWSVPLDDVQVLVQSDALVGRGACYVGSVGATTACASMEYRDAGVWYQAVELLPGEGLTIAHELDQTQVAVQLVEDWQWLYLALGLGTLFLIGLLGWAYWYKTRYKPDVPIVVHYEPYADLPPMYTGVLLDGRLDSRDITAAIIYLAQQGYLKITRTEQKVLFIFETDDYELTLLRPLTETVSGFQTSVMQLIFADKPVGTKVRLSEIKSNQAQQKSNYKLIQNLTTAIRQDLVAQGYYESFSFSPKWLALCLVWVGVMGLGIVVHPVFLAVGFGLVVVGGITLAVVYYRRTRQGYEARFHTLGFKDFLSTTDSDRFSFHNAPNKDPETFMKYLPYAVAFGVEKEWAKVFKDVVLPVPAWYEGREVSGGFVATDLTHDLAAFSTALASSAGSSGTSGSSGSGSVGGGSGGGGGGSW